MPVNQQIPHYIAEWGFQAFFENLKRQNDRRQLKPESTPISLHPRFLLPSLTVIVTQWIIQPNHLRRVGWDGGSEGVGEGVLDPPPGDAELLGKTLEAHSPSPAPPPPRFTHAPSSTLERAERMHAGQAHHLNRAGVGITDEDWPVTAGG